MMEHDSAPLCEPPPGWVDPEEQTPPEPRANGRAVRPPARDENVSADERRATLSAEASAALDKLRAIGGPDDTRPPADIHADLAAAAAALISERGAWRREQERMQAERDIVGVRAQILEGDLDAAPALLAAISRAASPLDCISAADVLRNERPIPWLCERLQLAPGRPPALIGYAGDGKSSAASSLGLAFALGRPAWGCDEIRASRVCRVAYVDLDAGFEAAQDRVAEVLRGERIASGDMRGATFDVIDGKRWGLRMQCTGTRETPTDKDEAAYLAAWRGLLARYDLAIVDNLRKLGPGLNFDVDPRAAVVLDLLGEASMQTSNVPLVLAHSPKGQGRGPHQAMKGRADLEGATGANVVIWRDEDQRRHVELTRGVSLGWRPILGYLDLDQPPALCIKCGGKGKIAQYDYHEGGQCFRCCGSGQDPREKIQGPARLIFSPDQNAAAPSGRTAKTSGKASKGDDDGQGLAREAAREAAAATRETAAEQRKAARNADRDAAREAALVGLIPSVVKAVESKREDGASATEIRFKVTATATKVDRARELAVERGLIASRRARGFDRFFGLAFVPSADPVPEPPQPSTRPDAT